MTRQRNGMNRRTVSVVVQKPNFRASTICTLKSKSPSRLCTACTPLSAFAVDHLLRDRQPLHPSKRDVFPPNVRTLLNAAPASNDIELLPYLVFVPRDQLQILRLEWQQKQH